MKQYLDDEEGRCKTCVKWTGRRNTQHSWESWGQQPRREAAGAGLHGSVLQKNHIKDYRVGWGKLLFVWELICVWRLPVVNWTQFQLPSSSSRSAFLICCLLSPAFPYWSLSVPGGVAAWFPAYPVPPGARCGCAGSGAGRSPTCSGKAVDGFQLRTLVFEFAAVSLPFPNSTWLGVLCGLIPHFLSISSS